MSIAINIIMIRMGTLKLIMPLKNIKITMSRIEIQRIAVTNLRTPTAMLDFFCILHAYTC
jgi:formate-dependent phosphoribosylglycinamide formyltransferase (GAR transformylase)